MQLSREIGAEIERLGTALDRLESVAEAQLAASGDRAGQLEAERDLLRLKHRRLVQETDQAVAELDRLLADADAR